MTPTRRTVLRQLAASAAAALVSPALSSAVTYQRPAATTHNVWTAELLDALAAETSVRLDRSAELLAAMGEDYGRLTKGACKGAVYPASAGDVRRLVQFARRHRVPFTLRGAGHSQGGQAVAAGSVTMRFNAMDGVGEIDTARSTVTASPGALWRSVLSTTAPRGFAPEVLPLYLDLTVGGTFAVGGIGSTSHRYGAAVSSVEELEVVTGGAETIRCGAEREAALFGAVLGGIGRYGVITSATLRLRRITPFVRTFTLLYDDLSLWLADQRLLIGSGRAEYIEGFCTASAQGYRTTSTGKRPFAEWFYGLAVSVGFDTPGLPVAETVLKGLRHRKLSNTEDEVHETFLSRLDTAIAIARTTGAFQRPHPHFEVLLPGEELPELLPQILNALPLALGDGHRLLFVRPDRLPHSFVAPRSAEIALLAIRPEGVQEMFLQESLDALRRVHSMCTSAGGTMYLPGWLGMMDAGAWRTHFGDRGAELAHLRHRFDPNHVFHSLIHSSIPEN